MTQGKGADTKILVKADDLKVGYGKKVVAQGIHFSLHEGEIMVLIGPNGSGKSTLLKTVSGFLPALGGQLMLNGGRAEQMNRLERAKYLSVVTTHRPDVEWMKVWDVAASGRYPYTGRMGILSDEDIRIVENALDRLQAYDLRGRYFSQLSDGQKQRVMLAKSIAQRPKVLILDEPTSFLDLRYQLEFIEIASELAREDGIALMMSLHELHAAVCLADSVLTLKGGYQDKTGTKDILTDGYIRRLYDIPDRYEIPAEMTSGGGDGI